MKSSSVKRMKLEIRLRCEIAFDLDGRTESCGGVVEK